MVLEKLNRTITRAHNYLYANEGLSNSEALEELLKLMYCKIEIEKANTNKIDKNIQKDTLLILTKETFDKLQKKYPDIFPKGFKISDSTVEFIMNLFWDIKFINLKSDKKGHILQKVMDRSYRERNGQFFTPNAVVDFIVKMIEPKSYEKGGDVASGTGGFIFSALEYIYENEKIKPLSKVFFYEISEQISNLIKMRMLIEFDYQTPNIKTCDTLATVIDNDFDYILSNPPFGAAGKITNQKILKQYELGLNPKTGKIFSSQVPDILFVEKIITSLSDDGRAAVILPDGNLENPSTSYFRNFLLRKIKIDAIVSLPNGTFIPYGTGVKASVIFFTKLPEEKLQNVIKKNYPIFFSKISKLGYTFSKHSKEEINSDGSLKQDYNSVVYAYKNKKYDDVSFLVDYETISKSNTFSYSYFSPVFNLKIKKIKENNFAYLGDIVKLNNAKVKFIPDQIYEYIEIADINSAGSEIINSELILGEDLPSRASHKIKENDIILAIAGNAIGTFKHSKAIVTKEYSNSICTNGFAVIEAKKVSPYYLIYFFNTDDFLSQVNKYKYGSAIPTISKEDLLKIVVPIPQDSTMLEIEKNIKKAYEYKKLANNLMKKE